MEASDSNPDPAQDLRRPLIVRIGVAVVLLVAIAVGLHWLGGAQAPVPPDPAQAVTAPLVSSRAAPDPAASDAPAGGSIAAAPVAAPAAGPPTSTEATSGGSVPPVQETGPAAAITPPPSATNEAAAPEPVEPAPESSPVAGPTASRPPSQPPTRIPRGPHLQAGVFLQPANAEQLKSRLEAQGIPVYIESRVQVGPFPNRQEAERVRAQLEAMGVTTVLIGR